MPIKTEKSWLGAKRQNAPVNRPQPAHYTRKSLNGATASSPLRCGVMLRVFRLLRNTDKQRAIHPPRQQATLPSRTPSQDNGLCRLPQAPRPRREQSDRRSLYASYATGLFSMGQSELLTMVIPLWAVLQGASPTEIGTLVGARSMLTFFLAIHGGALMDRLGARRVLMFFAFATGALAALYPFLPWFPAMVTWMLIGAGNWPGSGRKPSSRK
jgi:hypothetical protein